MKNLSENQLDLLFEMLLDETFVKDREDLLRDLKISAEKFISEFSGKEVLDNEKSKIDRC